MGTAQVQFSEEELLADTPAAEPLVAGGVRCHGGFDEAGSYVSPRTRFRVPAIAAWGEQNSERFSSELIDVPLEWWARSFPNVDQARFLIRAGVPEPLMATLTRIGTVEGYGANIRLLEPTDLQRHFLEDVGGTAIGHLGGGLFEAHGRDEAGWEEEAGHRDMWFAARTSRSTERARSPTSRRCSPGWASDRGARAPAPPGCSPTTFRTSSK